MVWVLTVKIYFKLFSGHFSKTKIDHLSHSTNMLCAAAKPWYLSGKISPVYCSSCGYIAMLCRLMLRKKLVGVLRRRTDVIYGCKPVHHYWGWIAKLEYCNISNTLRTNRGLNMSNHWIWQYIARPFVDLLIHLTVGWYFFVFNQGQKIHSKSSPLWGDISFISCLLLHV